MTAQGLDAVNAVVVAPTRSESHNAWASGVRDELFHLLDAALAGDVVVHLGCDHVRIGEGTLDEGDEFGEHRGAGEHSLADELGGREAVRFGGGRDLLPFEIREVHGPRLAWNGLPFAGDRVRFVLGVRGSGFRSWFSLPGARRGVGRANVAAKLARSSTTREAAAGGGIASESGQACACRACINGAWLCSVAFGTESDKVFHGEWKAKVSQSGRGLCGLCRAPLGPVGNPASRPASAVCRNQADGQPRAGCFGVAAQRGKGRRHPPARCRHVDPPGDTAVCPHPKFSELPVQMPDMRCAKSLQPDVLHRLRQPQQPGAQRYRQGRDFGVDGRHGFDRPIHLRVLSQSELLRCDL